MANRKGGRKVWETYDRGEGQAENLITQVFRRLLRLLAIDGNVWPVLMDRYLNDKTNNIPSDPKIRSSERGNLNKALTVTRMTWGSFMKGMKFISYLCRHIEIVFIVKPLRGPEIRESYVLWSTEGDVKRPVSSAAPRTRESNTPTGEFQYPDWEDEADEEEEP